MRIPTLILASAFGLALAGAAQTQSSVGGTGQGTTGSSGIGSSPGINGSVGGSSIGSPATTGTAPGAGAVRSPNAAPLPSAGRAITPGTNAPGAAPSGASGR